MGQKNNENLIDASFYRLVLSKLKHILVNGFYLTDEVRYQYKWDNGKNEAENKRFVMQEDAVLNYFLTIGVISGLRIENEFRKQQIKGNETDKSFGVWANWDKVDPAYREYEWVVLIHGINSDKFRQELEKFNMKDEGLDLAEDTSLSNRLSKPVFSVPGTKFTVHDAWRIAYDKQEIVMQPQVRKIAAYIMENSLNGMVSTPQMIIDKGLADTTYNVADNISRARACFKNATKQDKKFFPNERNIGYRFTG